MTTSFDKSKLKVLLVEGIHSSAERIFRDVGYKNIETVKTVLTGEERKGRDLEETLSLPIHDQEILGSNSPAEYRVAIASRPITLIFEA